MITFTPSKIKKFQDWIENEIEMLEKEKTRIESNEKKLLTQIANEEEHDYYVTDKQRIEKELKDFYQLRSDVERELDKVKLYFGLLDRSVSDEGQNMYDIPRSMLSGLADFGKPVVPNSGDKK